MSESLGADIVEDGDLQLTPDELISKLEQDMQASALQLKGYGGFHFSAPYTYICRRGPSKMIY